MSIDLRSFTADAAGELEVLGRDARARALVYVGACGIHRKLVHSWAPETIVVVAIACALVSADHECNSQATLLTYGMYNINRSTSRRVRAYTIA